MAGKGYILVEGLGEVKAVKTPVVRLSRDDGLSYQDYLEQIRDILEDLERRVVPWDESKSDRQKPEKTERCCASGPAAGG